MDGPAKRRTPLAFRVGGLLATATILGAHWGLDVPGFRLRGFAIAYAFLAVVVALIVLRSRGWWGPPLLVFFFAAVPLLATDVYGYTAWRRLEEIGAGPPHRSLALEDAPPSPVVVHVSDVHAVPSSISRVFAGTNWDDISLARLARALPRLAPRYVLVSGDMTDTGDAEEWERLRVALVEPAARAQVRVILAPGTHELQPAFHRRGRRDDADERARRFFAALGWTGFSLKTADGVELSRLSGQRPARHCQDSFPLVADDPAGDLAIVVLCSAGPPAEGIGDAALGSLGAGQLERLGRIVDAMTPPRRHVIVMLHHPPARRARDLWKLPMRWWPLDNWTDNALYQYAFLGFDWRDAHLLIERLAAAAERHRSTAWTVVYGHHHVRSLGSLRRLTMVEAPALFGRDAGVWLGYRDDQGGGLAWTWATLPGTP